MCVYVLSKPKLSSLIRCFSRQQGNPINIPPKKRKKRKGKNKHTNIVIPCVAQTSEKLEGFLSVFWYRGTQVWSVQPMYGDLSLQPAIPVFQPTVDTFSFPFYSPPFPLSPTSN